MTTTPPPAGDPDEPQFSAVPPAPYGGRPYEHNPAENNASPSDERLWSMLAHASALLGAWFALAFLGPLIVLLVKGDSSPVVRRHAVEALNFGITTALATVLAAVGGGLLALLTLGLAIPVVLLFVAAYGIYWLVAVITASLRAWDGQDYRYPLNLRFVS